MTVKIELTPDDIVALEHDMFTQNLESESFIRREIFEKGALQNEHNLCEGEQFSQLFDMLEEDIESNPMLFDSDEISS